MPDVSRKQQSKAPRKIALKKATGSQILSGLHISKVELRHAEKALASAKRMLGGASVQSKVRIEKAVLRRGKAIK
jgi:hypothetical protein